MRNNGRGSFSPWFNLKILLVSRPKNIEFSTFSDGARAFASQRAGRLRPFISANNVFNKAI